MNKTFLQKLFFLILFGIAFGLLEAIVVFYIRTINGHLEVKQHVLDSYTVLLNLKFIAFVVFKHPALINARITMIETFREFSTIVMLIALAVIAGQTLKQRIGAFLIAFAFWDIFYYVFLHFIVGWPNGLFDIDIYFIIPVPWIGPVITPVVISICMIIIGIRLFLFPTKNDTVTVETQRVDKKSKKKEVTKKP